MSWGRRRPKTWPGPNVRSGCRDADAGPRSRCGALLANDEGQVKTRVLLRTAQIEGCVLRVRAGVVAQVWRGGPRQARVVCLLADPTVRVLALDDFTARAVGLLAGRSRHADAVDVHVALVAREHRASVVTSDPDDLGRIDPTLELIVV